MYSVWISLLCLLHTIQASPCVDNKVDSLLSTSGRCATYQDQLADGSMGFCAGLVDYPFFLPTNSTQERLDLKAAAALTSLNPAARILLTLLPPQCTVAMKQATCGAAFQRCELVDDFFLDDCDACDVSTTCRIESQAFATCRDPGVPGNTVCGVQPGGPLGAVQGGTQLTWPVVFGSNPQVQPEDICTQYGLTFVPGTSADGNQCMRAIPRSLCKSDCDKMHDQTGSAIDAPGVGQQFATVCPLVTGYFYDVLRPLFDNAEAVDPFIHSSISKVLGKNGCDATQMSEEEVFLCSNTRFNVNLFSLIFEVFPSCSAIESDPNWGSDHYVFGQRFTLERYQVGQPRDETKSIGYNIESRATALYSTGCSIENSAEGFSCDDYLKKAKCYNATSEASNLEPQPVVAFGPPSGYKDTCMAITSDPIHQQLSMQEFESIFQMENATEESRRGLRYVQPALNMPPMMTKSVREKAFVDQPNSDKKTPLCSFAIRPSSIVDSASEQPKQIVQGTNAHECAHLQMQSLIAHVPGWVALDCQTAIVELACRRHEQKFERRSLCFLNAMEECTAADTPNVESGSMPFQFLVPVFPAMEMCRNVHKKCSAYLDHLQETNLPAYNSFTETFRCDQPVGYNCSNSENHPWHSEVWPCSTVFDGLPVFPESRQFFLKMDALPSRVKQKLQNYLAKTGKPTDYLEDIFSSETVRSHDYQHSTEAALPGESNATLVGLCTCPHPLQAPDNPQAAGLEDFVCCDQPCLRTYFPSDFDHSVHVLTATMGALGLLGSSFIACTWATFAPKRKQYIILCLSASSALLSAVLLAFAAGNLRLAGQAAPNPHLCASNTEPARAWGNAGCALQAVASCFLGLAIACWWFCQALDLYLKVTGHQPGLDNRRGYHAFAWGLPALCTAALLASDSLGYAAPLPFCFIAENRRGATDALLFYGPLLVLLVAGAGLVLAALRTLARNSGHSLGSWRRASLCSVYYNAAAFVAVAVFVGGALFAHKAEFELRRGSMDRAAGRWVACLLRNYAQGLPDPARDAAADVSMMEPLREPGDGCGAVLPVTLGGGAFKAAMAVAAGQGVFVYLLFGLRKTNLSRWGELVLTVARPIALTFESSRNLGSEAPATGTAGSWYGDARGQVPEGSWWRPAGEKPPRSAGSFASRPVTATRGRVLDSFKVRGKNEKPTKKKRVASPRKGKNRSKRKQLEVERIDEVI